MADEQDPFTAEAQGVRLAIRLTPGAHRNALDGIGIGIGTAGRPVLRLRLMAPPVEGAANTALIEFLANALSLRKADISIRSGETSRLKILHLSGDTLSILERLRSWIGNQQSDVRRQR